jgi:hypothetical protein
MSVAVVTGSVQWHLLTQLQTSSLVAGSRQLAIVTVLLQVSKSPVLFHLI